MTFQKLLEIFDEKKVNRVFFKKLSPNDNSKNQPYFGSNLAVFNILPVGEITSEETSSSKKSKTTTRIKAPLNFFWVSAKGEVSSAPNAQLIFYPQYPEMRFSGFIRGCKTAPSKLMDPKKRGREEGRILLLGTNPEGEIYGYLADRDCCARELSSYRIADTDSVLQEVILPKAKDTEAELLKNLKRIHEEGWIRGKRILPDGNFVPCVTSPNCGGYTMEAELGISANGRAEPDFLGWEIKQFGVKNFTSLSHVITLMTPEPDGGVYTEDGVLSFLREFGYQDTKGREDRQNFGGIFRFGKISPRTGLRLELIGYDSAAGKITDVSGGLALVSKDDRIAAMWGFTKLIEHWKTKHARAAYIPSLRTAKPYYYHYGKDITLCRGTDFMLFLGAVSKGKVYIDPAIKAEKYSTAAPAIKRRNQIRISFKDISDIYHHVKTVDCTI